jgi:hypothetical protein
MFIYIYIEEQMEATLKVSDKSIEISFINKVSLTQDRPFVLSSFFSPQVIDRGMIVKVISNISNAVTIKIKYFLKQCVYYFIMQMAHI